MNKKDLAIQWAKTVVLQDKLVYSDKFFDPFNDNYGSLAFKLGL